MDRLVCTWSGGHDCDQEVRLLPTQQETVITSVSVLSVSFTLSQAASATPITSFTIEILFLLKSPESFIVIQHSVMCSKIDHLVFARI